MTTPLTREERERLKELAGKATPGPWGRDGAIVLGNGRGLADVWGEDTSLVEDDHNAAYIAAANPSAVLALIEEVERLEQLVHTLKEKNAHLRSGNEEAPRVLGSPGVRDPDSPCDRYAPGKPSGDCKSDGHYLCSDCEEKEAPHA